MFESLFEFLFKYRPLVFEQGQVRFGAVSPGLVPVVAVLACATASVLAYASVRGEVRARDRAVLAGLRLGTLATLLFCLTRPVLALRAAVPQQNFVGILLDDSRSMSIADQNGKPRSAFLAEAFGRPDSGVLSALSSRFVLRLFSFSASAEHVNGVQDLTFTGSRTHLGDALERVREELTGLPLAGLVVVSDGADTGQTSLEAPLLALRSERIPVFSVGVGRETHARDLQISRVATPRSVLRGTSLAVDVVLTQTGYAGSTATLIVEDAGRILASQDVTLPADGEPAAVRIHFAAAEPGPRVFRFRVPALAGEEIPQNNVRDVLVEVRDRREKILYFEGEPRYEVKFIRRAVADDRNLQLAVLQRTAENKYLRLDVDSPEELAAGFPKQRDELFAYRGIVLGSIEAAAFSGDQLQMIADFVDRRGGGLLALGGPRAFDEGKYAGTQIADVLPVVLGQAGARRSGSTTRLRVRPTRAGSAHPATQIAGTERESATRWNTMPEVTSVNALGAAKPGAAVLLDGTGPGKVEQIVLAWQRYGRGKSIAFPIQDSWVWQMDASVAVDDMTHETYWRQLLRWLVDGVPDQVEFQSVPELIEPGEEATIVADVADSSFIEVNDARVTATVTGPSGQPVQVPLLWTGQRNGEYRATFMPAEQGLHELRVEAARGQTPLGQDQAHVRVGPSDGEFFDATRRTPLLRRISEQTGGRFYAPEDIASLADDLKYTGRGVTSIEERDLWDMPVLLLAMLALTLGEWVFRRARKLA